MNFYPESKIEKKGVLSQAMVFDLPPLNTLGNNFKKFWSQVVKILYAFLTYTCTSLQAKSWAFIPSF